MDASGNHLGTILTEAQSTNVAFGGDDWKTLIITNRFTMARVSLKIAGIPVPQRAPR